MQDERRETRDRSRRNSGRDAASSQLPTLQALLARQVSRPLKEDRGTRCCFLRCLQRKECHAPRHALRKLGFDEVLLSFARHTETLAVCCGSCCCSPWTDG
ncbi:hypothetical protein COCMIDRAFT_88904 [Bipolaris oryzae ATCC 44560]|uniref:Uncharacterized protein n=1 Tax=Bipolaris oryzae ATCC 44560 TaxID=930090 RepID=W6ZKB2_COCMI|nr:uncharacterized protein COCMIDRAFT_88904 [Bipolaris oryzae ATCC 44560]EUC47904.1 hypothetical protein COCMIDRAFT_88904 [Bipolaris oryzae ATCC 44560]